MENMDRRKALKVLAGTAAAGLGAEKAGAQENAATPPDELQNAVNKLTQLRDQYIQAEKDGDKAEEKRLALEIRTQIEKMNEMDKDLFGKLLKK